MALNYVSEFVLSGQVGYLADPWERDELFVSYRPFSCAKRDCFCMPYSGVCNFLSKINILSLIQCLWS